MEAQTEKVEFVKKGWSSHWVLWENNLSRVITLKNPNRPADHGGHIVVEQKNEKISAPYQDYLFFAKIAVIAAVVQKAVESIGIAPHCNIQFNGNWAWRNSDGSLQAIEEGIKRRKVHAHIYPRLPDDPNWADPAYLATHKEQVVDQVYEGRCFTKGQILELKKFLEKEIPIALALLQKSFS